jgi:hypothetical protein
MASKPLDETPTSSTQLAPTTNIDVRYLANAFGLSETEIQTLLAAPTADLAQKFVALAFAKAQAYDNLKVEKRQDALEHKQPCHFMIIPPELRLQIYQLVFQDVLENDTRFDRLNGCFPRNVARRHL